MNGRYLGSWFEEAGGEGAEGEAEGVEEGEVEEGEDEGECGGGED